MKQLSSLDLWLLFGYLAAMVLIGGLFYRRRSTSSEFFLANRSASWIPVAISILATDFSAISYLGMPAFVFQRDLQIAPLVFVLALVVIPIVRRFFVPFYSRLNLFTAYEYLERRFDVRVRLFASGIFLIMRGIYLGIVIYAPSLVVSVVTGLPLTESILLVGVLTTIYTALGGIKAVIWTDVAQFFVIIAGLAAILAIAGSNIEGGLPAILADAQALGKLKVFDFSLDPNREFTFWSVMIGGTFLYLNTYGTDQVILQRYLITRSMEDCRRALKLEAFLLIPVLVTLQATGVVLSVYYFRHPAEAAGISLKDAVLPYFTVQNLPSGLSGLVIASIFAAAMSTVSGGINSLTTATVGDFYRRLIRRDAPDAHYLRAGRLLTVAWGAAATVLALFAGRLGELANAYNKVNSLLGGVMLGIFLLGMLTRRVTGTAALAGALLGFATVAAVSGLTRISWLFYGLVGCSSTFAYAWLISTAGARERRDVAQWTMRA